MKMKQKQQIAALRGRGDSYKKIGLIEDCGLAQSVLCDTLGIDVELAEMNRELEMVSELSRKAIYENARTAMSQSEWSERNNSYLERHRQASQRLEEMEAQKHQRLGKGKILEEFIREIQKWELAITEFDEKLTFRFKNGSEVEL